jgi:hypothetical protein
MNMKKIGLAVLIAIVAASPALAAKRKQAPAAEPTFFERNDAGYRFVHDSMPIYWPSVVKMVVYSPGAAAEKPKRHKK